ncbi:MAG: phosphoribosylanthranilate isomerase [Verrucomicrobia bacterium]|nr:phosphoribosylanthranilate isomerase [Verrucomicrobiota bacterium]MBT7067497.1 phosphoribosylanthranilate isomerase [Verrucomicrobiota bacterium]MBT7700983.1 phosphoribosylanthranilate isomerase [Verrucomicrobiota bacterium]
MKLEIKICGITNIEDARSALELEVDYLGFIFYAKSPRAVTVEQVHRIMGELDQPCRAVGVFVNSPRADVERVVQRCGLWAAQIHGDEDAAEFAGCSLRLWRALKMLPTGAAPAPDAWAAERYVVDAAVPGAYGGTGVTADWEQAREEAQQRPVILAGGLKPSNVAAALRAVAPRGLDVSSGIELMPGIKDHAKMTNFVARAREVAAGGDVYEEE